MDLKKALKAEIQRVAKKQIREDTEGLRRAATRYRADIAQLKRDHAKSLKRLELLERDLKRQRQSPGAVDTTEAKPKIRFSAGWLRKHRAKLGLSAADYAELVGVHQITIYNWEQGKSKPRQSQLVALAEIRSLGKREAWARLEQNN